MLLPELLLQRMQLLAVRQTLDGGDLGLVRLHGEQETGPHAVAVQADRAGATDAVLAPDVRTGQIEVLAQEVREQAPRLDLALVAGAG